MSVRAVQRLFIQAEVNQVSTQNMVRGAIRHRDIDVVDGGVDTADVVQALVEHQRHIDRNGPRRDRYPGGPGEPLQRVPSARKSAVQHGPAGVFEGDDRFRVVVSFDPVRHDVAFGEQERACDHVGPDIQPRGSGRDAFFETGKVD